MIYLRIRRPSRGKLLLAAALMLLLCTTVVTVAALTTDMTAEENRLAFLQRCGYETAGDYATDTVTIPATFHSVYEAYNALQRAAGYDLSLFRGKTVTRYTYTLLNESADETVLVHLLVYEGKLIGGDVMNPALDGWMKGLPKR